MMNKFPKRTVLSGAILAAAVAAPSVSFAEAYAYSVYDISFITFEAQYEKDNGNGTTSLVWARPASHHVTAGGGLDGITTIFRSSNGVTRVNPSDSTGESDQQDIDQHIPDPGDFPVDADVSFLDDAPNQPAPPTNNAHLSVTDPRYRDTSGTPGFGMGDGRWDNTGVGANPFGVIESKGERSRITTEASTIDETEFTTNSQNTFNAHIDLADLTFDDDPGAADGDYDGTNLGWTGQLRLSFTFATEALTNTTRLNETAEADYSLDFGIFRMNDIDTVGSQVADLSSAVRTGDAKEFGDLSSSISAVDNNSQFVSFGPKSFQYTWDLSNVTTFDQKFKLVFNQEVNTFVRSVTEVPEPASLGLMSLGLLGLGAGAWRRRRA